MGTEFAGRRVLARNHLYSTGTSCPQLDGMIASVRIEVQPSPDDINFGLKGSMPALKGLATGPERLLP